MIGHRQKPSSNRGGMARTTEIPSHFVPIGMSAAEDRKQRTARSIEYRMLEERYAVTRELAWQLIRYRMDEGLTQQELADRVGTSFSQISRIESGRYMPSGTTLQKLAAAMDRDLRIVFAERKECAET
jgi:DNA-binding XRE family transcriptional regulator